MALFYAGSVQKRLRMGPVCGRGDDYESAAMLAKRTLFAPYRQK